MVVVQTSCNTFIIRQIDAFCDILAEENGLLVMDKNKSCFILYCPHLIVTLTYG